MTPIDGFCSPGFEAVREAFENNFNAEGEVGAALSIYSGADCLVDLWGGYTDSSRTEQWQSDTLVNIWSTTKGVVAACFAMAVDRGVLKYQDKVSDYWPEFGANGKSDVTVAELLSHQGGLCGFREPAATEDYYNLEAAASKLAGAKPLWTPGTRSGYHAVSMGALTSALFKRAEGRYIREFVSQELRDELGFELFIGLPRSQQRRCATLIAPPEMDSEIMSTDVSEIQIAALANPPMDALTANSPEWRDAEIPSANGHATARSLAQLYSALARSDGVNGRALISNKTHSLATEIQIEGIDAVVGFETRWACGFLRNIHEAYGPNHTSFGHSGWGGSFAYADPDANIGVAYTMNRMGTDLIGDPRNVALISAIYQALGSPS